ncbi:hypothetical protein BRC83_06010 [Halobacteriales archaeon QS_1_68_17]|nr:MAG: hypothetical protein BRC83_06010 [Halobacteriales archaeon QS_1_68_17]
MVPSEGDTLRERSGRSGSIQVLHVDDDPELGRLTVEALEHHSDRLRVESATGAREGLAVLANRDVDCVVSDYQMPEMDGLELLDAVRARDPELPFILFTGHGSEEIASEAISAGVTDYLQKETAFETYAVLANRIENAVSEYRARTRLELALEATDAGVWDWDLTTETVDRHPTMLDLLGLADGGLAPALSAFLDLVHPDHRDRVERTYREATAVAEPYTIQFPIETGGDGYLWVEEHGQPIPADESDPTRYVGTIIDVTDRRQRERDLGRSRERYRRLIDAAPVPILVHGRREITYANAAAAEFFAANAAEALEGRPVGFAVPPADREAVRERIDCIVESDGRADVTEQRFRALDGTERYALVARTAVHSEDSDEAQAILQDITERHERVERLEALHGATQHLLQADSTTVVAERAVDSAREIFDRTLAGIWFYDGDRDVLAPAAQNAASESLIEDQPTYTGGESLSWQAFVDGETYVADDLRAESGRYNPETPLGSELVLPLGHHGMMNVGATDVAAFDETDVALAELWATTVSLVLSRLDPPPADPSDHPAHDPSG